MCARDELRHIIWHYDVWRNVGHNYDVYVYPDHCAGACADNDVYVHDYDDIYVRDVCDAIYLHDDHRLNNNLRLNDNDRLNDDDCDSAAVQRVLVGFHVEC